MTDGVEISPATKADVEAIAGLIRGLAEYERLADEVVMTPALLERHLFGERPHAEVVIARRHGAIAGFALFFHTFSTFLGRPGIYLEDLYVVPEQRRGGIGRALLGHLAALAVERDCGRLEWSVLDWNTPSIEFYERLGARPAREWIHYRLEGPALSRLAGAS